MGSPFVQLTTCGYILSPKSYSFFALQCATCEASFGQWSSFIQHLTKNHMSVEKKHKASDEKEWNNRMESILDEAYVKVGNNAAPSTTNPTTSRLEVMPTHTVTNSDIREKNATDLNGSDLKNFSFNLYDDNLKKVSLRFLKLMKDNPLLWKINNSDAPNMQLQSQMLMKIKLSICKMGFNIDDTIIRCTIQKIIEDYHTLKQRLSSEGYLEESVKCFYNKCSFLQNLQKWDSKEFRGTVEPGEHEFNECVLTSELEMSHRIVSNQNSYRGISFNMPMGKIAYKFLNLLREEPILWNHSRSDYNDPIKRKQILDNWTSIFKEQFNITFTHEDLTENLKHLRSLCNSLRQRKELDAFAQQLLSLCNFYPNYEKKGRIQCQYCDMFFLRVRNHQAHLYQMHQIGENPIKCVNCAETFTTVRQLNLHYIKVHKKEFKFPCPHCKRQFLHRCKLVAHLRLHTGEKRFTCDKCGKSFQRRVNLKKHDIRVHLRLRNFQCHLCAKAFYTKDLLQYHINGHLNIRNKICEICGKGFHSCNTLAIHKKVHIKEKVHVCAICGGNFKHLSGLKTHMKKKHEAIYSSEMCTEMR